MASNYEQLVKSLRGLANGIWKNCEYTWFSGEEKVFADAAAAIEELEKERDYYKQQYENRQRLIKSALGEEWT